VNNTTTETRIDERGEGIAKYVLSRGMTQVETVGTFPKEQFAPFYLPTEEEETHKELEETDMTLSTSPTGEIEREIIPTIKRLVEIIESAISLLDEVLEVYDDEIERINTFSLFEEEIKSLWELREEANKNFVDVLVLLEVAAKNSHYKNYQKHQYQSIKMVLEKIKSIYITPQNARECRRLLMDNGIDLFAPIRNWENYTVEIKKNSILSIKHGK